MLVGHRGYFEHEAVCKRSHVRVENTLVFHGQVFGFVQTNRPHRRGWYFYELLQDGDGTFERFKQPDVEFQSDAAEFDALIDA